MKCCTIIIAIFCVALPSVLSGQNFEYPEFTIHEVAFSGPNLDIRKDDGTGIFTFPKWTAAKQDPVAYVSGSSPEVDGSFSVVCESLPDSIWIRGLGPEYIFFPPQLIPVTGTGPAFELYYPTISSTVGFENDIVRMFKPFSIQWEFSFAGGSDSVWRSIGETANTLYVTKTLPMPEGVRYKWYQTVFDLSCRNADGKSSESDIIGDIWNEFTDHVIYNWEGDSLHYYKTMNTSNVTLGTLLKYRNAQCYTFAQLFLSTIKIQGIVRTNNYVYITPINNSVCGNVVNRFIVKNWEFGTPNSTACSDFPYRNTYSTLVPSPYDEYEFIIEAVSDQTGIPGASTDNPASYFNNHQIAFVDGVYYDACYGVTFNSITEIKTAAFDGWSYRYFSGGVTNAFFTSDMSLSELAPTITTF